MNHEKPNLQLKAVDIVGLMIVIIMMMIVSKNPGFIDHWYSQKFFVLVCKVLHPIFNWFSFSMGDVFYILLIAGSIAALVQLVRLAIKKRFAAMVYYLFKIVIALQVLYIVFYLFWGLNYFRQPAAKRLNLQDTTYTFADIKMVTAVLIDSANICRSRLSQADLQQSNDTIYHTAVQAINNLSESTKGYPSYEPKVKPSMLSFVLNYIGTSGYYNPFTSEAQINYQMPVFLRPAVACHEMSHQMGFGAEDESDYAAFLAGISSADKLLRYSAYYMGVENFMHAVGRRDTIAFKKLKAHISNPVETDFKTDRAYWKGFEGKAGTLSGIFYDHFLKANNQPYGLGTYNRMVRLTMAYYRKGKTLKF